MQHKPPSLADIQEHNVHMAAASEAAGATPSHDEVMDGVVGLAEHWKDADVCAPEVVTASLANGLLRIYSQLSAARQRIEGLEAERDEARDAAKMAANALVTVLMACANPLVPTAAQWAEINAVATKRLAEIEPKGKS